MMRILLAMAALWMLGTVAAQAEDRADLEGTRIIGSRELPKVLVIVPWPGRT